jgi:carboxymethylenebutenolidase
MPDVSVGATAAYLAVPAGPAGPWPGVVVIHEAFGLNADIRGHADRLAALGYLALAPDLLEGRPWLRCVGAMFRQLTAGSGPAFDTLDECRGWLVGRSDCTGRTGVIGFCMGGGFALLCAPRDGYSAAAVNYGVVPADAGDALDGACPVVGSYGGRDLMGTSNPRRLGAALTALGAPHDVKIYPDAGHGFMSPRPAVLAPLTRLARLQYDKAAAEDAWQRIFAFFGTYLKLTGTGDFPGGPV